MSVGLDKDRFVFLFPYNKILKTQSITELEISKQKTEQGTT